MKMRILASVSLASLAVLSSTTAFAAVDTGSPADAVQGDNPADDTRDLDEIVVTAARKSEQTLDTTAAAVIAVSGDSLAQSGTKNVTELTQSVSGVNFTTAGVNVNVNIRGVGATGFGVLGTNGVGFVQDGVPLEGIFGLLSGFYDLERVEVLKGPQGTLYGLNSTSGVISIVSAKPKIGKIAAGFDGEYGNYHAVKGTGYVNVPLGDSFAARVSGTYTRHDPYISNTYSDQNEGGARAQLLYAKDAISLLVAGDYFRDTGTGSVDLPLPLGSRGLLNGDPYFQTYAPNNTATTRSDAGRSETYRGIHAELNADLGFATLTVIPSYRKMNSEYVQYVTGNRGEATRAGTQKSVEARLTGDTGRLNWLLGGYVFWGKLNIVGDFLNSADGPTQQSFAAGTRFSANGSDYQVDNKSQSVFGQGTFSLTDTFRVTAGLRYSHDSRGAGNPFSLYTIRYYAGGVPAVTPALCVAPACTTNIPASVLGAGGMGRYLGAGFKRDDLLALDPTHLQIVTTNFGDREETFSHVDYKLGVEFDVSPNVLLYADTSSGYRAGGVNAAPSPTGGIGGSFKQEELTAYEAGMRAHFGGLRAHLNGFYWIYKNHQESAVYLTALGNTLLTQNLPKGKVYGADLELDWRPTKYDNIGLQISYLESDTGPFTIGPAGGPPGSQVVEPVGHDNPNSPKWTINGNVEHIFPVGGFELVARAEGHYQSKLNYEIRFKPATEQEGFFTGNALLTFRPESQAWYIGAYVRNFTDKAYLTSASRAPGPVDIFYGYISNPRTYGVRAGVRF